jgi:heat shock protein HslJ
MSKRVKKYLLLSALLCIVAACNLPAVAANSSPAAPATAPAGTQPPAGVGNPSALTGTTWLWIGFTSPNDQLAIETPTNYSLLFQPDGSLTIKADCKNAQGSYQVEGQSLKLQVGQVTGETCPSGSRSDEFIQDLGSAAAYSIQGGTLSIDLAAEGGTLVFASAEAVDAGPGSAALRSALQANPWQWASFAGPAGQYDVESPANYQLIFHEDGTVDLKSDCNNVSGTYTLDGIKISILMGPETLAACSSGSRSDEFLRDLGSAATYFYQPGELFLDLSAGGGTMRFVPVVSGN